MIKLLKKQYPITAIISEDGSKVFNSYYELYSNLLNLDCDEYDDIVYIGGLRFYGGKSNADSISSFIEREYDHLPVKDKVVIDIGANIGDSSIYFALKGARRIVAVEPDPKVYALAKKNIETNGLSDRIELVRAACANTNLDSQGNNNKPLVTLDRIIEMPAIKPSILKMDCEGCEYDVILSASTETLLNFSNIQIEYHLGYKNLKEKLEGCGFQVRITEPKYFISLFGDSATNKLVSPDGQTAVANKTYSGMLYAARLNPSNN